MTDYLLFILATLYPRVLETVAMSYRLQGLLISKICHLSDYLKSTLHSRTALKYPESACYLFCRDVATATEQPKRGVSISDFHAKERGFTTGTAIFSFQQAIALSARLILFSASSLFTLPFFFNVDLNSSTSAFVTVDLLPSRNISSALSLFT